MSETTNGIAAADYWQQTLKTERCQSAANLKESGMRNYYGLPPCPGCGKDTYLSVWPLDEDLKPNSIQRVDCDNCGYSARREYWGNRPLEAALQAQVDRLQAKADRLGTWLDEAQATCKGLGQTADNFGAQRNEAQAQVDRLREALEFVLFNMDEEHPEDIGTVRAHVKNALREAPDA